MTDEKTAELDGAPEQEQISVTDTRLHSDTVNTLILAAVIVFFGSVFIALTNYQDFSEKKPLTIKSFLSGQYLSEMEKRFNSSLPLQDYIHNANVFISSLFGLGSDGEYIDIEGKRAADDPYSIDQVNLFTPITDSYSPEDDPDKPDDPAHTNKEEAVETTDDGKNKKLSGITMKVTYTDDDENSPSSGASTTTNNNPPGATTTTTVPPTSTSDTSETEPPDTEPTDTEPPDTEPPESTPDSETDSTEDSSSEEETSSSE